MIVNQPGEEQFKEIMQEILDSGSKKYFVVSTGDILSQYPEMEQYFVRIDQFENENDFFYVNLQKKQPNLFENHENALHSIKMLETQFKAQCLQGSMLENANQLRNIHQQIIKATVFLEQMASECK